MLLLLFYISTDEVPPVIPEEGHNPKGLIRGRRRRLAGKPPEPPELIDDEDFLIIL